MSVNRPLEVSHLGQLNLSYFQSRQMSSKLQLNGHYHKPVVAPSGECLRGKGRLGVICSENCLIHA